MSFLSCVGFCDYGVVRKLGSSVGCPLNAALELSRETHEVKVVL